MKTTLKGTTLGALALAWWTLKQGHPALSWLDVGSLAGLGLCWLLDRRASGK